MLVVVVLAILATACSSSAATTTVGADSVIAETSSDDDAVVSNGQINDPSVEIDTEELRGRLYGRWRMQSASEQYPDLEFGNDSIIAFTEPNPNIERDIDFSSVTLRTPGCGGFSRAVTWEGNVATIFRPTEWASDACDETPITNWQAFGLVGASFEIELDGQTLTVTHYNSDGEYEWDAIYDRDPEQPGFEPDS